ADPAPVEFERLALGVFGEDQGLKAVACQPPEDPSPAVLGPARHAGDLEVETHVGVVAFVLVRGWRHFSSPSDVMVGVIRTSTQLPRLARGIQPNSAEKQRFFRDSWCRQNWRILPSMCTQTDGRTAAQR